jgi:hypothetical protein
MVTRASSHSRSRSVVTLPRERVRSCLHQRAASTLNETTLDHLSSRINPPCRATQCKTFPSCHPIPATILCRQHRQSRQRSTISTRTRSLRHHRLPRQTTNRAHWRLCRREVIWSDVRREDIRSIKSRNTLAARVGCLCYRPKQHPYRTEAERRRESHCVPCRFVSRSDRIGRRPSPKTTPSSLRLPRLLARPAKRVLRRSRLRKARSRRAQKTGLCQLRRSTALLRTTWARWEEI